MAGNGVATGGLLWALPSALIEALQTTLAIMPADEGQRTAQHEIITALEFALEARRQRIIISQSTVSTVKWAGLLLQALCALIAIAMVHSDNRTTCRIALMLFATGIALSVLLIAAYSHPFTGEISVGPELLKQVVASPVANPGSTRAFSSLPLMGEGRNRRSELPGKGQGSVETPNSPCGKRRDQPPNAPIGANRAAASA